MPLPLVGGRITLRWLRREDALDVFEYASDAEVTRFVGWSRHLTPLDSLYYIRRCLEPSPDFFTFGIEDMALRRIVGSVDLRLISRLRRVGEIGYTLARSHWGRGYNTEAANLLLDFGFGELGLRRVQAICDIENHRSYRTMEKLGMVRDRVLKGGRTEAGSFNDRYQYSLLRPEWQRLRGARAVPPPGAIAARPSSNLVLPS